MPEIRAYRIAAHDTPLWALPNRRAGRFNGAGEGETQYLCLHPLGPWAEILRAEGMDEEQAAQLRLPLWALRVCLEDEPARIGFENATEWGISPQELVSDDHGACRRLARKLRADPAAPKAIVVPSAALPGTENLVLFGPRVRLRFLARPIDERDVPLSLLTEDGSAPRGLNELVHCRGEGHRHPALDAWERGEDYAFREPSTAHLAAA